MTDTTTSYNVKNMGCVTIARNGYVQELEEKLFKERALADKLAVELSACKNMWMLEENTNAVKALNEWKQARHN